MTPAPATVALIRQRYREGVPVSQIQAEFGVRHLRTLYDALDGKLDDGSGIAPAPLPRRRVRTKVPKRLRASRETLVARLWRTAERQVRDIELRLAGHQQQPDERERDARVLAVLVKTLRELHAVDGANMRGKAAADLENDDQRDIDEFRRDLARKLDAIVAERTAGGARNSTSG
jgi:hypothetical protein